MKQKPKDLFVILFIYLLALGAAILTLKYAPITSMLWKTALADFVAMCVVFVFSMIYKNSSVYDPYWSAAPIFIVFYWLYQIGETNFLFKAIWALIILWGVRLTWNWILRWDGMKHEDWRYVNIRKKTGKMYWAASFLAIHLLPTALVFAGLVPVYYTSSHPYFDSVPVSYNTHSYDNYRFLEIPMMIGIQKNIKRFTLYAQTGFTYTFSLNTTELSRDHFEESSGAQTLSWNPLMEQRLDNFWYKSKY